ncbi:PLC-like phosphodiesterase [Aspergillus ambiguus]|uniref:PI-PLC domain-containing protein n=1 Tax=Aspergillus ambiguus TaxID=176160 RepID=UPI003CCDFFE0
MNLHLLALSGLFLSAWAADGTQTTDLRSLLTLDGTVTSISDAETPTGDYISYTSTRTLQTNHGGMVTGSATSLSGAESAMVTDSASENATTASTSSTLTVLSGGHTGLSGNSTANATSTATSTSAPPVNTQPCNNYPEFCARKYSNITMVAAHNSPFVQKGSVAANQVLKVDDQLNDGVRMLQFQTHYTNDTIYLCHTSCDLLNAGPLEDYLTEVTKWLRTHPYDVVTILIGNYDYVAPGNFSSIIESSGLIDYVYTPPKVPMGLDDWPALSSMIMTGKRAVVFMDYQANQTAYPWLMDEFSQMWETPFSPTNRDFPCTVQRPPGLNPQDINNRMYMANHNLNVNLDLMGISLLIPNTALLNQTNAVSGYGSLGWMAGNCSTKWNRPPNFLLVDYYNYGNYNGSVFEVAADMNNVTYDRKCCGAASAGTNLSPPSVMGTLLALGAVQVLAMMV